MLRAYFDAGTKYKPRRVFYIAGYVGFSADWTVFDRKWRAFLRENELPHFHMTDYVARTGYYKGWPEKKRLAVMKRIVALASETARLGMAATLLPDDYDRLPEEDRDLLPDPYGLCLIACLAKTARTLHREVDEKFEGRRPFNGNIARFLASQDFVDVTRSRSEKRIDIDAVRNQPTRLYRF
jgi:hypothetical protein